MRVILAVAVSLLASSAFAGGSGGLDCSQFHIDAKASVPLAVVATTHAPGSCHFRHAANGMRLPDESCTPGAVNPTVTADVLRNPKFRTGCVRGALTTEAQKQVVYGWYGLAKPKHNNGPDQTAEIDHLISVGLAGSDALENLWPQAEDPSHPAVRVGEREFKIKDAHAELGLMKQVKAGVDLATIQRRIAEDWTQFIVAPNH
jgi:hypothetical protein